MIAGSLTYNTELDTKGFQKGINDVTSKTKSAGSSIKSIIAGLGITQIINKAFNLITSNIDNAVKRLDTLNNFPKVMRNLGIGADESTEAIKQLSDNLQGLPTTLNDGALAVQRFTSKNGNVKKSVELFTAVNNAILAGGASAESQATALEQLAQAYSRGKPDMAEWRSIQVAMPAQLKQVAQAMGYINTDQLGEELRSGKVSMDDFMDAIMKLNKEGTGEFLSFEEQAKNSVGGIGTSLQNMKTAVIRGVATLVQSIDTSLKNAGFGGISDIITKIGQSIEGALKKVAEFIEKIDWKEVVETIKSIIPVLSAVVTGFLAMQVIESVNKYIKETIAGVNGLGIALKLIMAHPVIAVITAVVAALIILYQKCESFRNMVNDMLDKIKSAAMDLWEKIKPSLEKAGESLKQLWEAIQNLMTALKPLTDFIGSILAERLNFIINILGILIQVIGFLVTNLISAIATFISKMADFYTYVINVITNIINWFKKLKENPKQALKELADYMINVFKQLPQKMISIGQNIVQGLWNGINNAKQWILDKIKGFGSSILNGIKDFFGIHSPSTLFRDQVGKFIPQGIAVGIELDTIKAVKAIDNMNNKIISEMDKAVALETGKMNASANIKASSLFNNTIVLNAKFEGNVEMDKRKTGQILAPEITKTIKVGGLM